MRSLRAIGIAAAVVVTVGMASSAHAVPFTYTTLNVPGSTATVGQGINNSGEVTGATLLTSCSSTQATTA
jgi:hypothetical protein